MVRRSEKTANQDDQIILAAPAEPKQQLKCPKPFVRSFDRGNDTARSIRNIHVRPLVPDTKRILIEVTRCILFGYH